MSDTDKVVDLGAARQRKEHQRKEQKVEQLRERFTQALGLEKKRELKSGLWTFKRKKKSKPDPSAPEGW